MWTTNELIRPSKHSLSYYMVTYNLNFITSQHVLKIFHPTFKTNYLLLKMSPNHPHNNPHADSKKNPEDVSVAQGKKETECLHVNTNPKLKAAAHPGE